MHYSYNKRGLSISAISQFMAFSNVFVLAGGGIVYTGVVL
jgi:hypothetical protein